MADRGKRPMTPEEENADTWANKKRTRLTPVDGRRIEAIPETFDPSFHGPPPASMHFSTEDGSFALHPLPATRAHICKAEYRRYVDHYVYHMCRICYSNVYWSNGQFLCTRCGLTEIPCEMCTVRIHIADLSGPIMVNLFPNDIAHLLEMNYSSFYEYLIKGVDVRKLFEYLEGQKMLLHVQPIKKKEWTSWVALRVLKIPKEEGPQCALDDGLNNVFPELAQNGNGRVYPVLYMQPTTLDMSDYPVYARYEDVDVEMFSHDDPETRNGNAFRHGLHQVQFRGETNTSRSAQ